MLLNVNNRIVDNPEILKLVEKSYSECYQSIHEENEGFFVYLSIDIDPKMVDCNQHPSKKVVCFSGADIIYENIQKWLLSCIKEESSIKNIATNIISKGKMAFNVNKNMVLNLKNQTNQSQGNDRGVGFSQKEDVLRKPN